MEALKMALRQLEEHPDTFVNLCDVAMIDDADEDDDLDMVRDIAREAIASVCFKLFKFATVCFCLLLLWTCTLTSFHLATETAAG